MDKRILLDKLQQKKNLLSNSIYKNDNRIWMPRKQLFNDLRSTVQTYRKIDAINLAIELLSVDFNKINLYKYTQSCIPDTLEDKKYDMCQMAISIYLNERKSAARYIIENYLPIYKKQILEII